MSNVLDAVPPDARALIEDELTRRNPELLDQLRAAQEPTDEQSAAVVLGVLSRALRGKLWARPCSERAWLGD